MKQATVTIIETESGQLDINVTFCTEYKDSVVNEIAMFAVTKINEELNIYEKERKQFITAVTTKQ